MYRELLKGTLLKILFVVCHFVASLSTIAIAKKNPLKVKSIRVGYIAYYFVYMLLAAFYTGVVVYIFARQQFGHIAFIFVLVHLFSFTLLLYAYVKNGNYAVELFKEDKKSDEDDEEEEEDEDEDEMLAPGQPKPLTPAQIWDVIYTSYAIPVLNTVTCGNFAALSSYNFVEAVVALAAA